MSQGAPSQHLIRLSCSNTAPHPMLSSRPLPAAEHGVGVGAEVGVGCLTFRKVVVVGSSLELHSTWGQGASCSNPPAPLLRQVLCPGQGGQGGKDRPKAFPPQAFSC